MMKAIMYHYVRHEDNAYPFFTFLHFKDFCRQLDYFSENFNIIHPNALQESIKDGKRNEGLVLTFDDGLKDHYKFVFPELKKRGLSAIFYIPTGVLENNKILGVHRLHLLLGKLGGEVVYSFLMRLVEDEMLSHGHVEEFKSLTYANQVNDEKTQLVKRIMNYFISYEYREGILDTMMAHFFDNEPELMKEYYMQPNEIKEMHDAGMIIGSHTISHPVMSKLSADEQKFEIQSSLQSLENITGGLHHRTFCYPYGGFHSFTADTEQILTENDFLYSFNVEARDVCMEDLTNRRQALPRYNCNMFPHGTIHLHAN